MDQLLADPLCSYCGEKAVAAIGIFYPDGRQEVTSACEYCTSNLETIMSSIQEPGVIIHLVAVNEIRLHGKER